MRRMNRTVERAAEPWPEACATFAELPPEIIDHIASRLPAADLTALTAVNRQCQATLAPRALSAQVSHYSARATGLEALRPLLRQLQSLPMFLQSASVAASARCIDSFQASERAVGFSQVLQASRALGPKAAATLVELSIQVEALPRDAQDEAVLYLLAATRCCAVEDRYAVMTGLHGRAQPIYRASHLMPVLHSVPVVFELLCEEILRLPPACRALPLAELAQQLHRHANCSGSSRKVVAALHHVPDEDRIIPTLRLAHQFYQLPLPHRGEVSLELCRLAESLPEPDRFEVLGLLITQLIATGPEARHRTFDHLLHAAQGMAPAPCAVLLAELATLAALTRGDERLSVLTKVADAAAKLPLPARRVPLTVALYQSRLLEPQQRGPLLAQCRAAWLDAAEPGASIPDTVPDILAAIRGATRGACPGRLAGIILQALHSAGRLFALVDLSPVLEAARQLADSELALVIPKVLEQSVRRSPAAMLPAFFEQLAEIAPQYRYVILEELARRLWGLPADACWSAFRRLLAETLKLDGSRRVGMLLKLDYIVDVLDLNKRPQALIELIDATRALAPSQRSWMVAQLAMNSGHFTPAQQLTVLTAALDACASIPEWRAVVALVRQQSGALPAPQRSQLQARCEAMSKAA